MKSAENLARDPRLYLTEKNRLQKLSQRDFLALTTVEYRKPNFLFRSSVKLYCYFCQSDPTSRKIWKPFETLKITVFNDKWNQAYGLNKVLKLAAALQTVFFKQTWCRYKMLRHGNPYVTKESYVDGSISALACSHVGLDLLLELWYIVLGKQSIVQTFWHDIAHFTGYWLNCAVYKRWYNAFCSVIKKIILRKPIFTAFIELLLNAAVSKCPWNQNVMG